MAAILTGPEVDHSRAYSNRERLTLALSQYYTELRVYVQNPNDAKKPIVNQIAKLFAVPETTLRRHIHTPNQQTVAKVQISCQVLTLAEKQVLVERLLFLDDFNIPAIKKVLYEMAESLLHKRDPDHRLGQNWIYRFLNRHEECRYVVTKTIASDQANAHSWDVIDDFFWKVGCCP